MSASVPLALLAAALAAARAVQERAARRDREAVLRAAHELRGALSTVALAVESAASGRIAAADRDRATAAALARARVALDDLVPVPGRAPAAVELFAARKLLDECVAAARPLAAASGVELVVAWEGPPVAVRGERARLALALTNLVANAIEHGGGAVTVCGRSVAGSVRFEVSDEGPGLPASLAVLTRPPRLGVGVRGRGLAIARDVAARHRGHVAAMPSPRGAVLTLVVPALPETARP